MNVLTMALEVMTAVTMKMLVLDVEVNNIHSVLFITIFTIITRICNYVYMQLPS